MAASFAIVYNFTAELFPTPVRGNAVALGSSAARIGGAISPLVLRLYEWKSYLPGSVMSVLAISAGLLTFLLPETRDKPLPMTFAEADRLHGNYISGSKI